MPKLSVVMSVYNGEEYVADAIECILDQTYRDFELVLINDGSKDGSLGIMQGYAAKDDRIRIIDQDNTGLTIALRRGVEAAKGDYIARMDVDDVSLPTRFEKQMALIEERPDLVAVTTDVLHFKEDGPNGGKSRLRQDPRVLPLLLVFSNIIGGHGQMIYSREAYLKVGGYDPDYNYAEDYDLWTRLADVGPFARVPEFLYEYRVGHDSISSLNGSKQAQVAARVSHRQFEKVTGVKIDQSVALAMRSFWLRLRAEDTSKMMTWHVTTMLLLAVHTFYRNHPEVAHEKYETLRHLSARWWWRRAEFEGFSPLLRIVVMANVVRLGAAALIAKLRYGGERAPG
ncbi:MAG: glycosyltransferase [Erythrobacter sp.]|nr:glycosyltransferase [Erythrobacter sp.]